MKVNSLKYFLNFSSCNKIILAASGIWQFILIMHLASRISCNTYKSKLTLGAEFSFITIKGKVNLDLALSTNCPKNFSFKIIYEYNKVLVVI